MPHSTDYESAFGLTDKRNPPQAPDFLSSGLHGCYFASSWDVSVNCKGTLAQTEVTHLKYVIPILMLAIIGSINESMIDKLAPEQAQVYCTVYDKLD